MIYGSRKKSMRGLGAATAVLKGKYSTVSSRNGATTNIESISLIAQSKNFGSWAVNLTENKPNE